MVYHKPVMLAEVIEHLQVKPGRKYIDSTLGDGGHSLEILKNGGEVLGIDYDKVCIERASRRIVEEGFDQRFIGIEGNFKNIEEIAKSVGFSQVHGILYDLGYSSYQLDNSDLGLSFTRDEPLDMRIDKSMGVSAADLVNALSEDELSHLIFELSGEHLARKFAKAIVNARSLKKILTTKQLADILAKESSPGYERGRINPATRTFQALRLAVNDELTNLEESLPRAARLLLPGGKLIVISFQSLEDRLAKKFGLSAQPLIKELTEKPLIPLESETKSNPRARSAKMRVFERL